MGGSQILWKVAAFLAVAVAIVYGGGWLFRARTPTADDFAAAALGDGSVSEREFAAVKLGEFGKPARKQILDVLNRSEQAEVRVACIRGLTAQWDYRSMPLLLDLLNDSSAKVRLQAGAAVDCLLRRDYRFGNVNGDHQEAERQALIARVRSDWENFSRSSMGRAYIQEKLGEDLAAREEKP